MGLRFPEVTISWCGKTGCSSLPMEVGVHFLGKIFEGSFGDDLFPWLADSSEGRQCAFIPVCTQFSSRATNLHPSLPTLSLLLIFLQVEQFLFNPLSSFASIRRNANWCLCKGWKEWGCPAALMVLEEQVLRWGWWGSNISSYQRPHLWSPPPPASLLLMGGLVSTFVPAGWAFLSWDWDICLPQRSVNPVGMPGVLVIDIRGDGIAFEAL